MIRFDHVAITIKDLDESIKFYERLGYKLLNIFDDEEYKWCNMELNGIGLELFQMKKDNSMPIKHLAYSYDERNELIDLLDKMGNKISDSFYGDLNRESVFITDIDGNEMQFIKNDN